jgi:hypothetical protein
MSKAMRDWEADEERLRARLAEYEEAHRITVNDCGAPDEQHCSCVPSLRLEAKRLQARLAEAERLLRRVVNAWEHSGVELPARLERECDAAAKWLHPIAPDSASAGVPCPQVPGANCISPQCAAEGCVLRAAVTVSAPRSETGDVHGS